MNRLWVTLSVGLSILVGLSPVVAAEMTLRDAIYLYGQGMNAKGDKVMTGVDCDVLQLVLDVNTGFTDLAMAQAGSLDQALAGQTNYPDRIHDSAAMFAYALYQDHPVKTFVFKDTNNPGATSQTGNATAFGYCFSTKPSARVFLHQKDTCLNLYSDGHTASCQTTENGSSPGTGQEGSLTLRDAIYLYGQGMNGRGDKALIGENCDVFQLVLDVTSGYTDLAMAQAGSVDSALAAQTNYPDRIQASAAMFSYMLYDNQATKAFVFKDKNAPNASAQNGAGTVFGYCYSTQSNARVYLREADTCIKRFPDGHAEPLANCTPTTDVPPAEPTGYALLAADLAADLVDAGSVAQVVAAVEQALRTGGVGITGGGGATLPGTYPEASWSTDRGIVFNLAVEANARAISGRLNLDELGRMLADFGFPFAGEGTPGQQLLGFLRASLIEARAHPEDVSGFTPLFIAEMLARQAPAVDLANPATAPDAIRLTLLEVELFIAMFDRAYPFAPATPNAGLIKAAATVSEGACNELLKFYGNIGGKIIESSVGYIQDHFSEQALMALGMTQTEIALFGNYGKMFGALTNVMKIVKVAQIYAAGEVTLAVTPNPVRKPPHNGPRTLVSVKATAGIPEEAWKEYQQNNGSEAYQTVKSCLSLLGATIPPDLKDIASDVASWRVAWDLTRGSPRHATIPSDVNNFNASSAGNPFGMTFTSTGAVSAEATLKVDIKEESQLTTLFQGPIVTSDVAVRAKVFTQEPPSPAVLLGIVSLTAVVGSAVDLSVGWLQAMIPPVTNTVIKVEHHDEPTKFEATFDLSMTFDYPHFRGETEDVERHTITGHATGTLEKEVMSFGNGDWDIYYGFGDFAYQGVSTTTYVDSAGCTRSFNYATRNGRVSMGIWPSVSMTGNVDPEGPQRLNFGGPEDSPESWPAEQQTLHVACPNSDPETITFPFMPKIYVAAANAMNLQDDLQYDFTLSSIGMHLRNGRLLSDGTLELSYTTPKTVSLFSEGSYLDTTITAQNNRILLRPVYASAP